MSHAGETSKFLPFGSDPAPAAPNPSAPGEYGWFGPQDMYLFNEGSHLRLYDKLGSHPATVNGASGYHFSVWAPNADYVSVVGDFNGWDRGKNPLRAVGSSGVWGGFIAGVKTGSCYKYHIAAPGGFVAEKTDPFAFTCEIPPKAAAVTWDLGYQWSDADWMAKRKSKGAHDKPVSIYEVHLGSWMREADPPYHSLNYRDIAPKLAAYCQDMGFTHVELLPITEHPFFASWGYQTTGYFAATSRYGTPQDLMFLVDTLHQHGVAVILDWVPSHFATDAWALSRFDGTALFEHADAKQGFHPDWGSYVFNYSRHEVRSFLLSSAMFWLDKYHIDGLRVDAVASMLYLDYSRKAGEWVPNQYGGRENIDAVNFLRRFNEEVYKHFPDVQTFAEESTAWPMVSRPTYVGGLGFGYKWDMGWMHDTLKYFMMDPVHRKHHQNDLTFRMLYAYNESFVMPLSHDEVVQGKGPLWDKMAGDEWQKYAGMRLLFAYQWGMTGKKLIFMGDEIAQRQEWRHDQSIDWHLLKFTPHKGVQGVVRDLNKLYATEPALHELDNQPGGFEWIDCTDAANSVIACMRKGKGDDVIVIVYNFTPIPRHNYRVGVPGPGAWTEVLNTDAGVYGGSNVGNSGSVYAEFQPMHGQKYSVALNLPPLGAVFFKGKL
ncbi:glycogen branching protein : 1,4-alpha-glucan branching enzyme GlgB OS=Nitrolancea hollandica Lb GN=glgB PE=3 SV=1: CBM_48: Alpha-amylase: Alpha-amylase: Alpha-amylase_C [Gemmata massiliana]|uniref:1,4-alpha-glucan branching enzyme GlgB n=1 Tax=Gemmata massiliana TaxID=1210884 RepID=A0A6P2D8I5_9BACT|nr:1,4-alpha-glucan branching protein GlgB [Gemmata massiliana]VTR97538.1 glycogen branching protein : 1,4-alpha-glucan branching enzyme GlgB OS=Nitrolancea hollandica Lb GN=glgB PE=3 SV=1: CBM_48: Alpha-amylase: Alpha-amylase: Alpha-amylase_C [Gemmata massiliana]